MRKLHGVESQFLDGLIKTASEQDLLRENFWASESMEPDELLQIVTELEKLRQRNLQLQVQKSRPGGVGERPVWRAEP